MPCGVCVQHTSCDWDTLSKLALRVLELDVREVELWNQSCDALRKVNENSRVTLLIGNKLVDLALHDLAGLDIFDAEESLFQHLVF